MSIFGPEFERIWPKVGGSINLTDVGKELLKKNRNIKKPDPSKVNIEEFIRRSSGFPLPFGTNTCRVISQPKERYPIIEKQIASAYPVIHERVLALYLAFLEHKLLFGNERETDIYPSLTITSLVQRFLIKRCASFCGPDDHHLLLSGRKDSGGFTEVGISAEFSPYVLKNVLSYDEIKLSAFLSVSSHSEFINEGSRDNVGLIEEDKTKIIPEGVVVGVIGGRFEKPDVMEWQDIQITPTQNTVDRGYGEKPIGHIGSREQHYRRFWNDFYEEQDFVYETAARMNSPRFYKSPNSHNIFDNVMMKKRYAISFDTLLLEAEVRGAAAGKQTYIHVVGIGLGVWKAVNHQVKIFLETFTQRLKALLPKLPHVSVVHFSWFALNEWRELKNGDFFESETHPKGGIRTFLSKRKPAEKLPYEYADTLLVVSYAWDGNALPGNEFWMGHLSSTGDSATACSTLISEIQNPHINTEMVNGDNLHIATTDCGVMHISDYIKQILA